MAEQRERDRDDELRNRLVGHLEHLLIRELARKLIRPLIEATGGVSDELRASALITPDRSTTADKLAERFYAHADDVTRLLEPMVASSHVHREASGDYYLGLNNGDDGDLAPEELLDHVPAILVGWPKDRVAAICEALSAGGVGSGEE